MIESTFLIAANHCILINNLKISSGIHHAHADVLSLSLVIAAASLVSIPKWLRMDQDLPTVVMIHVCADR